MAKEFKEWDKAFTSQELHEERKKWTNSCISDINTIVGWPRETNVYSNAEIRHAVYFAEDAEEWQRFRVSMKGLSTKHKLCMLLHRKSFIDSHSAGSFLSVKSYQDWKRLEECRIDNYIGSLVRGGLLSPIEYRILK